MSLTGVVQVAVGVSNGQRRSWKVEVRLRCVGDCTWMRIVEVAVGVSNERRLAAADRLWQRVHHNQLASCHGQRRSWKVEVQLRCGGDRTWQRVHRNRLAPCLAGVVAIGLQPMAAARAQAGNEASG